MGGVIGCESEVGEGTTFWIEFPQSEKIHDQVLLVRNDEDRDFDQKELPRITGTVLYVEDNPENLELMELIVSGVEGLTMISSHNAEQGIELARTKEPDLIILDINLPGMDDIEAMKKLRQYNNTKRISVLALSAAATERDIEKGMEAGFLSYLTKSIQISEVVGAIESALKS